MKCSDISYCLSLKIRRMCCVLSEIYLEIRLMQNVRGRICWLCERQRVFLCLHSSCVNHLMFAFSRRCNSFAYSIIVTTQLSQRRWTSATLMIQPGKKIIFLRLLKLRLFVVSCISSFRFSVNSFFSYSLIDSKFRIFDVVEQLCFC